jgi:hypothetical protein
MKKDLKKKLNPVQYKVTQQCGTEPAFNNEYWDNKKEGYMLMLSLVSHYLALIINLIPVPVGPLLLSLLRKRVWWRKKIKA